MAVKRIMPYHESRDFDAIRLRRAPAFESMQEDNFAFTLGRSDLIVLRTGQSLCQLRELVIVSRK